MKGRSVSFQKHYSIPPRVKPRFTIFWFSLSFLYFLSSRLVSRRRRGSAFWGAGRGGVCIFMLFPSFLRFSPLSVLALSAACGGTSPVNVGGSSLKVTFWLPRVRGSWHRALRTLCLRGLKAGAKCLKGQQKSPVQPTCADGRDTYREI